MVKKGPNHTKKWSKNDLKVAQKCPSSVLSGSKLVGTPCKSSMSIARFARNVVK